MSTEEASTPTPPTEPEKSKAPHEIRLYSHSTLFYWWPVWAIGFVLALITYFQGHRMFVVPKDTAEGTVIPVPDKVKVKPGEKIDRADDLGEIQKQSAKKALILPSKDSEAEGPLNMSRSQGIGVLFIVVLLIVVVITNVPLRGMWSVLIIITIILVSVIFATLGWWDDILNALALLDIRINMGGYVAISLALLVVWLVTFFFFDRQIYITFVPGQFKVHLEIGAGEKTYDTIGMTIEKQRGDFFRHWVLGWGSGDMVVRTSGADAHEFRLSNVLFVSKKLQMVEEMQRVRQERNL